MKLLNFGHLIYCLEVDIVTKTVQQKNSTIAIAIPIEIC